MKLLMHICCGPCSIYPVQVLRDDHCEVMGFFYRNNIHPFTECMRREETLKTYAESIALKMIYQSGYALEAFLRQCGFPGSRSLLLLLPRPADHHGEFR